MDFPGISEGSATISLYNMVGETILSQFASIQQGELNTEVEPGRSVPAGMYLVKIVAGTDEYYRKVNLIR
jgi:hypothetical protein